MTGCSARSFAVKITEENAPKHKSGKPLAIVISKNEEYREWTELADGCGLGTAPRKLLDQMADVRSMHVILPTDAGTVLRLRTISRPDKHLAIILYKLKLPLPAKPKPI